MQGVTQTRLSRANRWRGCSHHARRVEFVAVNFDDLGECQNAHGKVSQLGSDDTGSPCDIADSASAQKIFCIAFRRLNLPRLKTVPFTQVHQRAHDWNPLVIILRRLVDAGQITANQFFGANGTNGRILYVEFLPDGTIRSGATGNNPTKIALSTAIVGGNVLPLFNNPSGVRGLFVRKTGAVSLVNVATGF